MVEAPQERPIRVLIFEEAETVTGPARNLLEFSRTLRTLDPPPAVSLSLATFVRGREAATAGNDFTRAVQASEIELHCIAERFVFDPRVIPAMRDLARRFAPDIIQTHHVKSHFLVRLSGLWKHFRWIAFHHGYTADARRTALYNQLDRWSLRYPQRIVAVCEAFKKQLISRGTPASSITVLQNAISTGWLRQAAEGGEPADQGMPQENTRVILAVGRLSKEKAFEDLLAALDDLGRMRPDLRVRLVIVGDGPERNYLQQTIDQLRLRDRVTLAGYQRDLRPWYQRADIVAISSLSEGSPNVLLEAMAGGVPVVATSVGGIPEILTDQQTGLLVPPTQPAALASALARLLTDSDLAHALAARARELINTQFSPRARALRLLALYHEVQRNSCG